MFFFRKYRRGEFSRIASTARIGAGSKIGTWARIAHMATLGKGCQIGSWARVGEGAVLGGGVSLGDHSRIGDGAIVGNGVLTGTHTRIGPGVTVPDGAVFGDADLVLEDKIIPRLCSGYSVRIPSDPKEPVLVSMITGRFRIPHMDEEQARDLIEAHFWGDRNALEPYRISGDRPRSIPREVPLIEQADDACAPGL